MNQEHEPQHDDESIVDWDNLRNGLRLARERCTRAGLKWTRTRVSEHSGIDVATIGRVENVARYPDYRPDYETIARIVRTLDLTMWQFMAQIESGNDRLPQGRLRDHASEQPSAAPPAIEQINPALAVFISYNFDAGFARLERRLLGLEQVVNGGIERILEERLERVIKRTFAQLGASG